MIKWKNLSNTTYACPISKKYLLKHTQSQLGNSHGFGK